MTYFKVKYGYVDYQKLGALNSFSSYEKFDNLEHAKRFAEKIKTVLLKKEVDNLTNHEWSKKFLKLDGHIEKYCGIFKVTEEEVE